MLQREEVADRLHSAAIHLLRRAAERDQQSQLSAARLSALSVVVFRGPLTLGELATAEGVRSATMTGIVNGLEQAGLVRRQAHLRDRRSVLVAPTSAGRRALARARRQRIEVISRRLAGLTQEELTQLWHAAEMIDGRFGAQPWQPVPNDS